MWTLIQCNLELDVSLVVKGLTHIPHLGFYTGHLQVRCLLIFPSEADYLYRCRVTDHQPQSSSIVVLCALLLIQFSYLFT